MRPIAILSLVVAPLIATFLYIYLSKRSDPSYRKLLLKSYLAGIPGIFILFITLYLSYFLDLHDLRTLKRTLFFSFITTGLASELGKFIPFSYYIMKDKEVKNPIQAITMSIMVSLGFSTAAVILFLIDPFSVARLYPPTLYSFVLTPANIIFAITMGFFVSMARFRKSRVILPLGGLAAAAFFHGLLIFCMTTDDYKLLSLFAFGSVVIVFVLGIKASSFKDDELKQ